MSRMQSNLDKMQDLADKLTDITSQLEDGTSLLGEWKDLADEYEPDDITGFIEKGEEWEVVESLYGLTAGEVEEKLDELSEWEDVSNWHGSPGEVKDKLEEHGSLDFEEMKSKVEEQKVLLADFIEERDFLVQRTIDIEAELEALKNRTRWQTFLSLFTGRS